MITENVLLHMCFSWSFLWMAITIRAIFKVSGFAQEHRVKAVLEGVSNSRVPKICKTGIGSLYNWRNVE